MSNKYKALIGCLLIAAACYLSWRAFFRPTPVSAAQSHLRALIVGDVEWLMKHATEREIGQTKITPQVLKEFHDEFVKTVMSAAWQPQEFTIIYKDQVMSQVSTNALLADNTTIPLTAFAYYSEGRVIVSVVESLIYLASDLNFRDIPDRASRTRAGMKRFGKWFRDHGMTHWYSIQDNSINEFKH